MVGPHAKQKKSSSNGVLQTSLLFYMALYGVFDTHIAETVPTTHGKAVLPQLPTTPRDNGKL